MRALDQLTEILPPPASPVEAGSSAGWGIVLKKVGVRLPCDYMDFITRYGSGQILEFFVVFNPFSENHCINLIDQIPLVLSGLREIKEQYPTSCPFPLYFEPGGFLPWGISQDGDIFGWLTEGVDGNWTTVVFPRHQDNAETFRLSFSEFLLGILRREVRCSAFSPEIFESGFTFQQFPKMR